MPNKILNFAENTNPFGPPTTALKRFEQASNLINIYPDNKNGEVTKLLADFILIEENNVAISNGSLEAIYSIASIIDNSKSSVISPTFWGFEAALENLSVQCSRYGIEKNLQYTPELVKRAAANSTLLYLCNPNNPTSSFLDSSILFTIIKNAPHCHFLIDESHLLISKDFKGESMSPYVEELGNVSIVYSLSKFFGIAGLRVGAYVSSKKNIKLFKKWQVPYSTNTIGQALLIECLNDKHFINFTKQVIPSLIESLYKDLQKISWLKPFPSRTCFVLCKIMDKFSSTELEHVLSKDHIYIRNLSSYSDLKGEWVRISTNRCENNKRLINKLLSL